MWVKFPQGADRISVEQQNFAVEATDDHGQGYCRVPDHFVPRLQMSGFSLADPPPGTDLPDLPQTDPLRDGAIANQAREIEAFKIMVEGLRTDLGAANASLSATSYERDQLKLALHEATVKIEDLVGEMAELRDAVPVGAHKK